MWGKIMEKEKQKKEQSKEYKAKLLILYDILKKHSDENNHLTTKQLIALLKKKGINSERKVLYKDVQVLNKYGFEVMLESHAQNEYFVLDRDFDDSELRVLMDAVQSANFISKNKSKDLINRIAALSGNNRAELLKRTINNIESFKTEKNTFYDVDNILNAIVDKKLIKFNYFYYTPNGKKDYSMGDKKFTKNINEAKIYVALPIDLVIQNNDYYVRTFDLNINSTIIYKIGRMENVIISEDDYTLDEEKYKEEVAALKNNAFDMYKAEVCRVTLRYNKNKSSQVFEKFGAHIYRTYDDFHYEGEINVALAPPFFSWCATFGGDVTIIAPKEAIDAYKKQLLDCLKEYDKEE